MNRLLKLMADNRGVKGARRFEVVAAADTPAEATVYLYDYIVSTDAEAAWYGGVSAESFVKAFAAIDAPTIHVRINSPGGDVFGARAMEHAIRSHKADVFVHIDGLAASAASFIALAGDVVEMADGSFLMIHKSWALSVGNADDLRHTAGILDQIDGTLAASYARRTGIPEAEIMAMLAAETWIGAAEAVDRGFADGIAETPDKAAASIAWDVSALKEKPAPIAAPAPDQSDDARAAAALRAQAERMLTHFERIAP